MRTSSAFFFKKRVIRQIDGKKKQKHVDANFFFFLIRNGCGRTLCDLSSVCSLRWGGGPPRASSTVSGTSGESSTAKASAGEGARA